MDTTNLPKFVQDLVMDNDQNDGPRQKCNMYLQKVHKSRMLGMKINDKFWHQKSIIYFK